METVINVQAVVNVLAAVGAIALVIVTVTWVVTSIVQIRAINAGHARLNGRFDAIKQMLDRERDGTDTTIQRPL